MVRKRVAGFRQTESALASTVGIQSANIREKGIWVRPTERVKACCDPEDDIFLECAQTAMADYLVTGNLKHFPGSWAGSRIVTPRWLLDNMPTKSPEGTRS
jgi:predicted nucleic acid-binding protein